MSHADLAATIDAAWEDRASVSSATTGAVRDAVDTALSMLDTGKARVAEKAGGDWQVNQWLKKAVLLSFRLNDMEVIAGGPGVGLVGQGALQVRRLGREPLPRGRLPRRSRRHRAALGPSSRPTSC